MLLLLNKEKGQVPGPSWLLTSKNKGLTFLFFFLIVPYTGFVKHFVFLSAFFSFEKGTTETNLTCAVFFFNCLNVNVL